MQNTDQATENGEMRQPIGLPSRENTLSFDPLILKKTKKQTKHLEEKQGKRSWLLQLYKLQSNYLNYEQSITSKVTLTLNTIWHMYGT